MRLSRWIWILIGTIILSMTVIALTGWLLGGARANSVDLTKEVSGKIQTLSIPHGSYLDTAWLGEDKIAFLYASDPNAEIWDYQIFLHKLGTQEWHILSTPHAPECKLVSYAALERLPNFQLGFVSTCLVDHGQSTSEISSLSMWDAHNNSVQVLQRYPEPFTAGPYTFAPAMTELIQEQPVGSGLNNKIYRVSRNGQMQQLFPNYQRVATPSWSPDGGKIAFLGTEIYPENKSGTPLTTSQIQDLFNYPWDLYVMDANGSNVHIVLKGIEKEGLVQWSPLGTFLAFAGKYKNQEGVWILNIDTLQVFRVWPYSTVYDWSPDGRQMVIIQKKKEDGVEREQPVIVDLSVLGRL
jgi:WD40-like Beta Propeller Repeat